MMVCGACPEEADYKAEGVWGYVFRCRGCMWKVKIVGDAVKLSPISPIAKLRDLLEIPL